MSIKKLVTIDQKLSALEGILNEACSEVEDFGRDLTRVVKDLKDTLHSDSISVGLAAPQIGYRVAVAVVNPSKNEEEDLVLINPTLLLVSGSWDTKLESCMSIPHKRAPVKRRKKAVIQYFDEAGARHKLSASGFLARIILHEIDHLNGTLYTDRVENPELIEETSLFRDNGVFD